MSDKLRQVREELKQEHDRLSADYAAKHDAAEAAWAEYEQAKTELSQFRNEFGRVLRAFDQGLITTTETE